MHVCVCVCVCHLRQIGPASSCRMGARRRLPTSISAKALGCASSARNTITYQGPSTSPEPKFDRPRSQSSERRRSRRQTSCTRGCCSDGACTSLLATGSNSRTGSRTWPRPGCFHSAYTSCLGERPTRSGHWRVCAPLLPACPRARHTCWAAVGPRHGAWL